jgi:Ring finger domain
MSIGYSSIVQLLPTLLNISPDTSVAFYTGIFRRMCSENGYTDTVGRDYRTIIQYIKKLFLNLKREPTAEDLLDIYATHITTGPCNCLNQYDYDVLRAFLRTTIFQHSLLPTCTELRNLIEGEIEIPSYRDLMESIFASIGGSEEEKKDGLTMEEIYRIPTESVARVEEKKSGDDHKGSYDVCTLCTKEMTQGQQVIVLPCEHKFHNNPDDCIGHTVVDWLMRKNSCPTCRREVVNRPHDVGDNSNNSGNGSTRILRTGFSFRRL